MSLNATPGDAAADALIDRTYFTDWAAAQGYDLTGYDPTTKIDPAIRRGSNFLNLNFTWKGTKVNGRLQPQAWPRDDVTDAAGETVPNDTIPTEIEQAAAMAAYQELKLPGSLSPVVAGGPQVKRTKVGPLEKEFFGAGTDPSSYRATILDLGVLVAGLEEVSGVSSPLAGESFRV
jgi:hypothetical protein